MNKRQFLITSSILGVIALVSGAFEPFRLCGEIWRECMGINYQIGITLIPALPLLLFSAITYRMPESVFQTWAKFAMVWIPLSMLAILVSPEYDGAFVPLFPIIKGTVAFASSALFVAISTLLIGWSYFKKS